MYAYEDEDATAAELGGDTPAPWPRMFDVRTAVLVGRVALGTSLETHFGNMLSESDAGILLEDALDSMYTYDPLQASPHRC